MTQPIPEASRVPPKPTRRRWLTRSRQVWLASVLVGLSAAGATLGLERWDEKSGRLWLMRVSFAAYDQALSSLPHAREGVIVDPRVVLVLINEHTRTELNGRDDVVAGEIRRSVHAQLVDRLRELGARVITFDMVFTPESSEDGALAAAMRRHGKVVVGARPSIVESNTGGTHADVIRPPEVSVPDIREAGYSGLVILPEDQDRSIRRFQWYALGLNDNAEDEKQPALAPAAVALYLNQRPLTAILGVDRDEFCGRRVVSFLPQVDPAFLKNKDPLMQEALRPRPSSYVGYVGSAGRGFKIFAYEDVLDWRRRVAGGRHDFGALKDALVIVGDSGELSHDLHKTPLIGFTTDEMPGSEIQANVAHTILTGAYIGQASRTTLLWLLFIACLLTALLARPLHPLGGLGVAGGILVALFAAVAMSNQAWRFWIDPVRAAAGILVAYGLEVVLLQLTERRIQREMLRTFGRIVGPAVRDDILREDRVPETRGELRPVTLLFSDLQGFTTLSEGMTAPDIVALVNEYFDVMLEIVDRHGGVVDKLMGDGIMAYFGAPKSLPDHAARGVACALEMQAAMEPFREAALRRGLPALHMRIGIHTGEAVVGLIGSRTREEYSVIGDIVNVASRLEGMNKEFGTTILVSEETYQASGSGTPAELIGEAAVRGRKQPVRVYAIGPRREQKGGTDRSIVE